ncbi:MAG: hypothetical protein ACLTY5_05315 [Angelakisella sp.]
MTRTREISGSGQIFALLVLSQCFWLLCCRPSLVNGLLSMAASAVAYGVVFLLAVFCRRCAARGETPLSPVFAAWGALLAVGYFAVTAEQLLSAARVLFEVCFPRFSCCWCCWARCGRPLPPGRRALGRAAFVSLFLFLIAVLLLTLGVLPQATALNLRLPEEDLSAWGGDIIHPASPDRTSAAVAVCPTVQPAAVCRPAAVGARRLVAGRPFAAAGGAGAGALRQPAALPHDAAGPVGRAFRHGAGVLLLLITAAFFRLTGLAVAAARLGGMAGCRPKCSLWAGVALSIGGVALLHYTGWPDAAVYPILAVTGLLWLIFALLPPRGTGNKRDRRR